MNALGCGRALSDTSGLGLEHASTAIDGASLGRALATTLFAGAGPFTLTPRYLRAKPGTSLLVLWEATFADRDGPAHEQIVATVGAGTLVADERKKWQSLHPAVEAREQWLAFLPESDLVLARFPFDLGLRQLPHLLAPDRIKRVVETLDDPFGDGFDVAVRAHGSTAELRSYKPRRRAVIRWTLRGRAGTRTVERAAIARTFAEPPAAGLAWRRALPDGRWPKLLSASADGTLLVESQLAGEPLPEARSIDPFAAGALLAEFHAATTAVADRFAAPATSFAELHRAAAAVALDIAALAPGLGAAARASLALLPRTVAEGGALVGAHGDLHGGQFLRHTDGTLQLLDLDRATLAPAALDLARLAGDWLRAASCATARRQSEQAIDALLHGYAEHGGQAPTRAELAPWIAATLLASASEPLRRCLPDANTRCERQLALVAELAAPNRAEGAAR